MTAKTLQGIGLITQDLATINPAIPILFDAAMGIVAIIKKATGSGPTASQIADLIEAQIAQNDAFGQAEIARLKARLALQQPGAHP